jgi:hypothetical protein
MTWSLEYEPAALNLATAPSAAVNWATHIGTRTDIRPLFSAVALIVRAVPSVTQPPQTNPIVIAATAPKAIPSRKRVRASPCKICGHSHDGFLCLRTQARSHRRLGKALVYEIAPSDGTLAAATTTSSNFGRRRFMDSFKVNFHRAVERQTVVLLLYSTFLVASQVAPSWIKIKHVEVRLTVPRQSVAMESGWRQTTSD